MWASSLTDSTSKGKPDIEAIDTSSRLNTLNEVMEVTTKPIIYDGDTEESLSILFIPYKVLRDWGYQLW